MKEGGQRDLCWMTKSGENRKISEEGAKTFVEGWQSRLGRA